jgi:hypothetical protein
MTLHISLTARIAPTQKLQLVIFCQRKSFKSINLLFLTSEASDFYTYPFKSKFIRPIHNHFNPNSEHILLAQLMYI